MSAAEDPVKPVVVDTLRRVLNLSPDDQVEALACIVATWCSSRGYPLTRIAEGSTP